MNSQTLTRPVSTSSRAVSAVDVSLLILRLALAVVFFAHGAQKVFGMFGGPGLAGTVQGMGGMGIPAPMAYLAAFTELFGSIALFFGVFSRLAAAGIGITMLVAIAKVHFANGFFLGAKPGFEFNFVLVMLALAIVISGPGRIALADWEAKLFRG